MPLRHAAASLIFRLRHADCRRRVTHVPASITQGRLLFFMLLLAAAAFFAPFFDAASRRAMLTLAAFSPLSC